MRVAVVTDVGPGMAEPDNEMAAAFEAGLEVLRGLGYWLFYGLTFLSGARRQIFIVFAGFMMVEKFGYSAAAITLLYLIN